MKFMYEHKQVKWKHVRSLTSYVLGVNS
jgi:hypothetical protein